MKRDDEKRDDEKREKGGGKKEKRKGTKRERGISPPSFCQYFSHSEVGTMVRAVPPPGASSGFSRGATGRCSNEGTDALAAFSEGPTARAPLVLRRKRGREPRVSIREEGSKEGRKAGRQEGRLRCSGGELVPLGFSGAGSASFGGAAVASLGVEEVLSVLACCGVGCCGVACVCREGMEESVFTKVKLLPRKSNAFFNVSEALSE